MEAYTVGSKSTKRKVGYTAVFTYTTKRGTFPEEASIHTAEIHKMGNIYRLVEFNADH